ncbi:MAG: DNA mismatch endonuclease Vsr [Gemmatimonadetes bacterium]|nr:DNA mismatch endonuclease Vsr [Gemmatimonadota bacterium]
MDRFDKDTRSRIMARIGRKNTKPEILLRTALHKIGLRYRLHDNDLPGSPDIVFPRFNAVIFIHGCYWHSHGCYRSTVPKTRRDFWTAKFAENRNRDARNVGLLINQGWRVLTVWECALVGKNAEPAEDIADAARVWLHGADLKGKILGNSSNTNLRC